MARMLLHKWGTRCLHAFVIVGLLTLFCGRLRSQEPRWTEEHANQWYGQQPWLVGGNFVPSDAINELEMWQADSFDGAEIDREFGWAENLGMNTMRVFLHNLLWEQHSSAFKQHIDHFLAIAHKHHIQPVFGRNGKKLINMLLEAREILFPQ